MDVGNDTFSYTEAINDAFIYNPGKFNWTRADWWNETDKVWHTNVTYGYTLYVPWVYSGESTDEIPIEAFLDSMAGVYATSVQLYLRTEDNFTMHAETISLQDLKARKLYGPVSIASQNGSFVSPRVWSNSSFQIAMRDDFIDAAVPILIANATESSNGETSGPAAPAHDSSDCPSCSYTAAAVGGSFGGLIVGILACALFVWWLWRRRSRDVGQPTAIRKHHMPQASLIGKEAQAVEVPVGVTGWQKHLPQDKDDGTTSRAVKTVFDQVQMYVEGYYKLESAKITGSAIATLERVSPDGLSKMLSKTSNAVPLLEAIIIRWIVHRISLRSDAGESFLPFEYTKIPEQNDWHMESDGRDGGPSNEAKKGFLQALSQWRMLTAFLHPDPKTDDDFKKHLEVKIDQGVRALTDAFSPWEKHGRSVANRNESLRRILQLSNDAGILLFAQPSTFVFDWTSREGTVTVSPAFVKRLDEFAKPLPNPSVLITARRVDV